MREFNKMIFLGNGDASKSECERLHERLDKAFMHLSGIQQGPYDLEDEQVRNSVLEIMDIVEDITVALGGYDIDTKYGRIFPVNELFIDPIENLEQE
jgi:hypothetical protein